MPHTNPLPSSPSKQEEVVTDKSRSPKSWFGVGLLIVVIAALIALLFPDVVFKGNVFFYRDAGVFNYPTHYFQRDCLGHGELPLWNPWNNCGIPFLAQWNVMALYPFTLMFLWLPMPIAITIFSFLHFFIAAAGMYFLALRWTGNRLGACVAGLAFAWNGLTLHALMWPNSCASIAWMGWVLFFVDKALRNGGRAIVYAALVGAMQMLAGVPEIIIVTWLVAFGIFAVELRQQKTARKQVAVRFFSSCSLVAGLTAAQMLPFFDLLLHSQRNTSYSSVDVWAMPPWGWANFFVPLFRTSPSFMGIYLQTEQQWTSSYYLGVGIMVLAVIGVLRVRQARVTVLAGIAVLGCILALGKAGMVYAVVQAVCPLLGFMRYPAKWVQLAMFCVPLLAAFGIAALQKDSETGNDSPGRKLWGIGIPAGVIILLVIICAYSFPRDDEPPALALKNGMTRVGFLVLTLGALHVFLKMRASTGKSVLGIAILFLVGLDVSTHMPRQQATVEAADYKPVELKMSEVPQLGMSRAMISANLQATMRKAGSPIPKEDYSVKRLILFENANLLDRVPKVNGMFSLYTKEQAEIRQQLYSSNGLPDGLAVFAGISQVCNQMGREGLGWRWLPRRQFLPMLTLGQKAVFADDDETKAELISRDYNPTTVVYLPKEARSEISATNYVMNANILADSQQGITPPEFGAHRITFTVGVPQVSMVVVAQTFYHAWKAYVDGKPAKVWRANYAFQAIEIPAGQHDVKFVYEDDIFHAGVAISLAALVVCAIAWFRLRKKVAASVQ